MALKDITPRDLERVTSIAVEITEKIQARADRLQAALEGLISDIEYEFNSVITIFGPEKTRLLDAIKRASADL